MHLHFGTFATRVVCRPPQERSPAQVRLRGTVADNWGESTKAQEPDKLLSERCTCARRQDEKVEVHGGADRVDSARDGSGRSAGGGYSQEVPVVPTVMAVFELATFGA